LVKFILEYFLGKKAVEKRQTEKDNYILLMLKLPKENKEKEKTFDKLLQGLYFIIKPHKEWLKAGPIEKDFSLEITSFGGNIRFYLWLSKTFQKVVEGQLYAQFPGIEIEQISDYTARDFSKVNLAAVQMKLAKDDSLAIKTYQEQEEIETFSVLSGLLSNLEDSSDEVWMQVLLRPVSRVWFYKFLTDVRGAILKNTAAGKEKVLESPLFRCQIRVLCLSLTNPASKLERILSYFKQFDGANKFKAEKFRNAASALSNYQKRLLWGRSFLLTATEITGLYHFPYSQDKLAGVVKTTAKKGEPPAELPRDDTSMSKEISVFAETNFRNEKTRFGIRREDRRRHLYVVGKSGTGKSKLLELLMLEDIRAGKGFGLIDPHGDLAETIIEHMPKERVEDVIYFNPADQDYPMAFNLLESSFKSEEKQQIVQGFIGIFKKIFTIDFNPRLEHMIRYIVLALLDSPGSTVLGINRLLTDIKFRQKVIANIQDPTVKSFWANEFTAYNERYANEAIVPILNKMGQFISNPIIRNTVGQVSNAIDFRKIMDEGKILIMNLSRGKLGEENSDLLGSMIITKIQEAAISRANIPEAERVDFYLYVDEFQNFATAAFANIFTEARKYHLNLTVAHQYLIQLPPEVRGTVFGNIGSLVSFRVGADDAAFLAQEFAPTFSPDDLISLDTRDLYLKISISGQTSNAFSAKTINCPSPQVSNFASAIVDYTRLKYARPRISVENEIAKWQSAEELQTEGETSFPEPIV